MKTPFSLNSNAKQDTIASTVNSSAQLLSKGAVQVGGRLAGRKSNDTTSTFEQQMQANLDKERRYYEEMVGIAEDNSTINLEELKKQIRRADSQLKNFKNFAKTKSLAHAKKMISEETAAAQWAELNTGIDQWKLKYLYPFGNIAPLKDPITGSGPA